MTRDPVGDAVKRLADAGIESARLDARLLWNFAKKISLAPIGGEGRGEGVPDNALSSPPHPNPLPHGGRGKSVEVFEKLIARRVAREPLAYIVGHKEFWSLNFAVGPGVLIPRPDTETLIEQLCESFPDRNAPLFILDLGTGSGCLLIAALKEYPNARGVGVDSSAQALGWAKQNVATHKLEDRVSLIESGWLDEASPGFDVILCNPPYIPSTDIDALEPEVRLYEPRSALDGGPDGLDAYRALAPRIGQLLSPEGRAFVEIGAGQASAVGGIFDVPHLKVVAITPDLSGISRCVVLKRDNHGG